MRIRISDARLVPDLLGYLHERSDLVVERLGDREVEASAIGSYSADAHRMELELLLRVWVAAHPGAEVELVELG